MKYIYGFGLQHRIQCGWWWVVANRPEAGNPIQGTAAVELAGLAILELLVMHFFFAHFNVHVRIAIGITEC